MARVLLLGPDKDRAVGIRTLLRGGGHAVTWLRTIEGWPVREREVQPDLVVAAVGSAERVLAEVGPAGAGFPAPLLVVQQEADFPRELYLEARLVDRLTSPFMSQELLGRVDALVRVRRIVRRAADPEPRRDELSAARGRGLHGLGERLARWLRSPLQDAGPADPRREVAARVAEWSDRRDAFEPGHAERVTSFCAMIAEGLSMDEVEASRLLRAARLHDIGKVALPVEVLRQQRPLEEAQRRLIRTHPARGAALLRALDPDETVARVVLLHHERPDGAGYYGRAAGDVPRAAYALAVAEAYDAMTSSRVRAPIAAPRALEQLQAQKGDGYDRECVEAFTDQLRPRTTCCIPLSRPARPRC
jgi:HD-GYP domain-containing protein (c-di-GMP phosphodiesterase class II)